MSSGVTVLMRTMTEGVWAMAPTRLHTQMMHRKMRKASWQPAVGHLPATAVANSLSGETHAHPLRFWGRGGEKKRTNKAKKDG